MPSSAFSRRILLLGMTNLFYMPIKNSMASDTQNHFAQVEQIFQEAIKTNKTPGAVAAIGHQGQVVWKGVFGQRALVPHPEAMTWNTLFDMASLTKVLITAPAIMQLYERHLVQLDVPVCHYLPAFSGQGKQDITVRQLLTHYSGLPPDLDLSTPWVGRNTAIQMAFSCAPIHPAGEQFIYSDINFILLGLIIEKLSGLTLQDYATQNILKPLGLKRTFFAPAPTLYSTIAPTQYDEKGNLLRGIVHDPTTRRMGGIAGHAGLFSCADDMTRYAIALLNKRAGRSSPFPLKKETLVMMSSPQQPAGKTDQRGLGWDINTHYSTPRGDYFPVGSFGHTGFTGTSLWLVPQTDSFVLILTNRVHPDGKGNVVALRHDVASAAALALEQL